MAKVKLDREMCVEVGGVVDLMTFVLERQVFLIGGWRCSSMIPHSFVVQETN